MVDVLTRGDTLRRSDALRSGALRTGLGTIGFRDRLATSEVRRVPVGGTGALAPDVRGCDVDLGLIVFETRRG